MESMRIRNKKLQFFQPFLGFDFFYFYLFSAGVIYQLIYLNILYDYYYTYVCGVCILFLLMLFLFCFFSPSHFFMCFCWCWWWCLSVFVLPRDDSNNNNQSHPHPTFLTVSKMLTKLTGGFLVSGKRHTASLVWCSFKFIQLSFVLILLGPCIALNHATLCCHDVRLSCLIKCTAYSLSPRTSIVKKRWSFACCHMIVFARLQQLSQRISRCKC